MNILWNSLTLKRGISVFLKWKNIILIIIFINIVISRWNTKIGKFLWLWKCFYSISWMILTNYWLFSRINHWTCKILSTLTWAYNICRPLSINILFTAFFIAQNILWWILLDMISFNIQIIYHMLFCAESLNVSSFGPCWNISLNLFFLHENISFYVFQAFVSFEVLF